MPFRHNYLVTSYIGESPLCFSGVCHCCEVGYRNVKHILFFNCNYICSLDFNEVIRGIIIGILFLLFVLNVTPQHYHYWIFFFHLF